MKLDGKVAIVTGAGQGIGRTIALNLAEEGASVVVCDINLQTAQDVTKEIESLGRQAQAIKADVSNSQEVSQLVAKSLDRFKKIDILVNNAGICPIAPAEEHTEDEWDKTIDINLKGTFLCSQAVGREMIKQKCGKIVNIASTSGHIGTHGIIAYSVSKAGVISLTRVLAVEWAKHNINVNAVSPGTVKTPMTEKVLVDVLKTHEERTRRTPLGREAIPEDVAKAVVFLISPEADYITGDIITVDGGMTAVHPGYSGISLIKGREGY